MTLRTHFIMNSYPRCGQPLAKNGTTDPAKVTCATCKRLMAGEVK